jgi:gamma-glutamyltranspeptidase
MQTHYSIVDQYGKAVANTYTTTTALVRGLSLTCGIFAEQ